MKALRLPFAAGALGGCGFVAVLLVLDVGELGTLIARNHQALPLLMLLLSFAALFGMAVAISSLTCAEQPSGHPLRLVRVASAARKPLRPSR